MSRFRCHELHNLLFVKLEKVVEIAKINEEDASDGPIKNYLNPSKVFLNMAQTRPLFVYFCPLLNKMTNIWLLKSVDGLLGIWTLDRMMVGADESNEL